MIRKATALALLLLLGLYLPAAGMPVCLCIGPSTSLEEPCCGETMTCCETSADGQKSCCGDPDCCVVISGVPDGMEPQAAHVPLPLSAPLLIATVTAFEPEALATLRIPSPSSRTAPPPGDPVRIAFGVWRL